MSENSDCITNAHTALIDSIFHKQLHWRYFSIFFARHVIMTFKIL